MYNYGYIQCSCTVIKPKHSVLEIEQSINYG